MAKKAIPDEIRQETEEIVERFNKTELNSDTKAQSSGNSFGQRLARIKRSKC